MGALAGNAETLLGTPPRPSDRSGGASRSLTTQIPTQNPSWVGCPVGALVAITYSHSETIRASNRTDPRQRLRTIGMK